MTSDGANAYIQPVPMRFDLDAAVRASDAWGANCGPGAIAAILGMSLDELRPHLGDFESKGYTNPTLMWEILSKLSVGWRLRKPPVWPEHGLARVQWEGPWMLPGVPMAARYRHTHWVGSSITREHGHLIFDINCICAGGWIPLSEWANSLVPWLLCQCEPKADGRWSLTHAVEISRAKDREGGVQ